ncbi:hypothetical protein Tco_1359486 [Tanacetum coccineum]
MALCNRIDEAVGLSRESKGFMFAYPEKAKGHDVFFRNLERFVGWKGSGEGDTVAEANDMEGSRSTTCLPEHPSDTKVLTMKMEILLEPTSNKLLRTDKYGDSVGYTSDDVFYFFFLDTYTWKSWHGDSFKWNLPDHRSILTDQEDQAKMEMETPHSCRVNSPPMLLLCFQRKGIMTMKTYNTASATLVKQYHDSRKE